MIIDSHAHYSHFKFIERFRYLSCENRAHKIVEGTREDVFSRLQESGIVGSIEPAIDFASNKKILDFCKLHPGRVFPAVGIHPTRTAATTGKELSQLRKYAEDPGVVAIGETGLDYHYSRKDQHRLRQMLTFQYQIDLAARRKLPLILHIRLAYKDAIRILKLNRKKLYGGVAHCFCGTKKEVQELIELGFHIGIGGVLLQENETAAELQQVVQAIPVERILVETDAPYVLPEINDPSLGSKAKRKIRNTSLILPEVIKKISELKEMDASLVEERIYDNTIKVFKISR